MKLVKGHGFYYSFLIIRVSRKLLVMQRQLIIHSFVRILLICWPIPAYIHIIVSGGS